MTGRNQTNNISKGWGGGYNYLIKVILYSVSLKNAMVTYKLGNNMTEK